MAQVLDPLLILALALNFFALSVSRIRAVIKAVPCREFSWAFSHFSFIRISVSGQSYW